MRRTLLRQPTKKQLLGVLGVMHPNNMSQPSQSILCKQIINTLCHAKTTSKLHGSEMLLPLNSSTDTQNATNTAVLVKPVQLINQLLGGSPGFSTVQQHYRSLHHPLCLQCQVQCSKHRSAKTAKNPRCLSNPTANLTNHTMHHMPPPHKHTHTRTHMHKDTHMHTHKHTHLYLYMQLMCMRACMPILTCISYGNMERLQVKQSHVVCSNI